MAAEPVPALLARARVASVLAQPVVSVAVAPAPLGCFAGEARWKGQCFAVAEQFLAAASPREHSASVEKEWLRYFEPGPR